MGIESQNQTLKKEGFMISRDVISVLKLFWPQTWEFKKIALLPGSTVAVRGPRRVAWPLFPSQLGTGGEYWKLWRYRSIQRTQTWTVACPWTLSGLSTCPYSLHHPAIRTLSYSNLFKFSLLPHFRSIYLSVSAIIIFLCSCTFCHTVDEGQGSVPFDVIYATRS